MMKRLIIIILYASTVVGQRNSLPCQPILIEYRNSASESRSDSSDKSWYNYSSKHNTIQWINFDSKESCYIDSDDLNQILELADYKEIKSKFSRQGLWISVTVKWKNYYFKFSPEKNVSFIIGSSTKGLLPSPSNNSTTIGTKMIENFKLYPHWTVSINGIFYLTSVVVVHNGKEKVIGYDFIKGFNWIIDFRSNRVYLKKNNLSLD